MKAIRKLIDLVGIWNNKETELKKEIENVCVLYNEQEFCGMKREEIFGFVVQNQLFDEYYQIYQVTTPTNVLCHFSQTAKMYSSKIDDKSKKSAKGIMKRDCQEIERRMRHAMKTHGKLLTLSEIFP